MKCSAYNYLIFPRVTTPFKRFPQWPALKTFTASFIVTYFFSLCTYKKFLFLPQTIHSKSKMGFFSKEEKSKIILRAFKTLFFLITMLVSLLLFSAPVLLAIADTLLPSALLSASLSPSSLSLNTLSSHFNDYDFRYSLIDIPLISIVRSAVIICKY